jgi:hypothetical protein
MCSNLSCDITHRAGPSSTKWDSACPTLWFFTTCRETAKKRTKEHREARFKSLRGPGKVRLRSTAEQLEDKHFERSVGL